MANNTTVTEGTGYAVTNRNKYEQIVKLLQAVIVNTDQNSPLAAIEIQAQKSNESDALHFTINGVPRKQGDMLPGFNPNQTSHIPGDEASGKLLKTHGIPLETHPIEEGVTLEQLQENTLISPWVRAAAEKFMDIAKTTDLMAQPPAQQVHTLTPFTDCMQAVVNAYPRGRWTPPRSR